MATTKQLLRIGENRFLCYGKLNRKQLVPMEIMVKFCKIFHCNIGDIMDVIEDD